MDIGGSDKWCFATPHRFIHFINKKSYLINHADAHNIHSKEKKTNNN